MCAILYSLLNFRGFVSTRGPNQVEGRLRAGVRRAGVNVRASGHENTRCVGRGVGIAGLRVRFIQW